MLRKIYLTIVCSFLLVGGAVFAQSGSIKGTITLASTGEPVPFANVVAERNGTQQGGAQTDFDGNFTIKPLSPGEYTLKATFVGYQTVQFNGVIVSVDKITYQNLVMKTGGIDLNAVEIFDYAIPLINVGSASNQTTVTKEDIENAPVRNVTSIVSTSAGIYQADEGDEVNVRGGRSNSTDYYIDGIKVRGGKNLPQSSIEQITTITGGVPASYGDATSGIISITTKGPSEEFFGGIELATSELFDNYGYNLASLTLSGPIYQKKTEYGGNNTIIGYFLSGEYL